MKNKMIEYAKNLAKTRGCALIEAVATMHDTPRMTARRVGCAPRFVVAWANRYLACWSNY